MISNVISLENFALQKAAGRTELLAEGGEADHCGPTKNQADQKKELDTKKNTKISGFASKKIGINSSARAGARVRKVAPTATE